MLFLFFFFFSSRRRHTRSDRDWSSDVCSSDLQKPADIEEVVLGARPDGTPIRVRDVGFVQLGPDIRRGVVDYNGEGDAAGGIVVVRFGESTYDVLQRVKQKLHDNVQPSLP